MFLEQNNNYVQNNISYKKELDFVKLAALNVNIPLPVVTTTGKLLGIVVGNGIETKFLPKYKFAYDSYDKLINQLTQSTPRRFTFTYEKNLNTAMTALSWYDMWPVRGNPTQGTYPGTALTARQLDDTVTGSLSHGGNVSPFEKYLLNLSTFTEIAGRAWLLYDRVLSYEACTFTAGSQSMTNSLTAQRYISSGQPGLQMCLTAQTVHNSTAANLTTLTYVNQSGNSATMNTSPTVEKIVSAAAPTSTLGALVMTPAISGNIRQPFLPLAVGDTGARSITNFTWSAAPTGTFCAALCQPLCWVIDGATAAFTQIIDTVNSIGGPIRIYDGACLSYLAFTDSTTAGQSFSIGDVGWTT